MLDRLVDGELPADARRELLAALDSERDGWRRCALAFIEAQTWRRGLREVVDAEVSAGKGGTCEAVRAEPSTEAASLGGGVERASRRGITWRESGAWLAVAAMVLIAFTLGRRYSTEAAVQLAGNPPGLPYAAETQPPPSDANAVTLVVNDHLGASHRLSVPLLEAREMGAAFSEKPNWSSAELDRRLDEHGLDLAARRRYVPLYFEQEDKRIPFVVPVDDALVAPVNRPVY